MKIVINAAILILLTWNTNLAQQHRDARPGAHFMVFSDPHYFDPSLGTEGEAFQDYLENDRKLLRESREILQQAIERISQSKADFILIPGDLTKDGSLVSHQEFAALIRELEMQNKEVFVIPGNHDILNGESNAFEGDRKIRVENISPSDFENIYADFGYKQSLYRDQNSLSYVTEPVPGLWLLGLDACLYRANQEDQHPHTGGMLTQQTMDWITGIGKLANEKNKTIITFMHHGVLEHYKGQEKFYGEYLVKDYKKISKLLASIGVRIVFTGHYHAQDITMKRWDDETFIMDVETGSLVTYPCPIRSVRLYDNELMITSDYITTIPSFDGDFREYSRNFVYDGIAGIGEKTMIDMGLKPGDAAKLSGQVGDAFITHYQGDEPEGKYSLNLEGVNLLGRLIISFRKKLIRGLYEDLPPQDNNLKIDLQTGKTSPGISSH